MTAAARENSHRLSVAEEERRTAEHYDGLALAARKARDFAKARECGNLAAMARSQAKRAEAFDKEAANA